MNVLTRLEASWAGGLS